MTEINNLTRTAVDENFLKKAAEKVLKAEKAGKKTLSVALVGEKRIWALNKKYLKRDRPTDVLSFPECQQREKKKLPFLRLPGVEGLGEIIICLKEVRKNSFKYKLPFKKRISQNLNPRHFTSFGV